MHFTIFKALKKLILVLPKKTLQELNTITNIKVIPNKTTIYLLEV